MRKTLFLTAILASAYATLAHAAWNEDKTVYTITSGDTSTFAEIDAGAAENTVYSIVIDNGVSHTETSALKLVSSPSGYEVNGDLIISGGLTIGEWGKGASTPSITGTGSVTVNTISSGDIAATISVANMTVTGEATLKANWGATYTFKDMNLTLNQGANIRGDWGIYGYKSVVNIENVSLTLGKALNVQNGGVLNLKGQTTIDVSQMSLSALNVTAPDEKVDGFSSGDAGYQIITGGTATIAEGATITIKDGEKTLTDTQTFDGQKILTGGKLNTSVYYLQSGTGNDTTTLSGLGAKSVVVNKDNTLTMNDASISLKDVSGEGNVTITSLTKILRTDGAATSSAAAGKLTISNATLWQGWNEICSGALDATNNSLASFTSVVLDNANIHFCNAGTTYNNVETKKDSTTNFFAHDMNTDTTNFAGTTTLAENSTFKIGNYWNAQFSFEKLTGSGTLEILALAVENGDSFKDSGSSNNAASYSIAINDAFNGAIVTNNGNASISLNIGENGSLYASKITKTNAASLTADGSGTIYVTGTTFSLGGVSLASSWAGSVIGTGTNVEGFDLSQLTANGTDAIRKVDGLSGYIAKNAETIGNLEIGSKGLTLTNGYSDNWYSITNLSGTGTITRAQGGGANLNVHFSVSGDSTAHFKGDCDDGKMTVKFNGEGNQAISSNFTKGTDSGDQAVAIEVEGAGTKTFSGSVTASSLSVAAASTVTFEQALTTGTLSNSGTLTLAKADIETSSLTLGGGSITLGTEADHEATLTTTTLTVNADSTINANLQMTNGKIVYNGGSVKLGCSLTLNGSFSVQLTESEHNAINNDSSTWISLITDVEDVDGIITAWNQKADGTYYVYANVAYDAATETYTYTPLSNSATTGMRAFTYSVEEVDGKQVGRLMVTPEPATATLSLLALAGLAARRRRH